MDVTRARAGRPLQGRRIVVTRVREQAAELVAGLESLGAVVVAFPTIAVAPPVDPAPLRDAVRRLDEYDWLVLTSSNGVERFWAELEASGTGVPERLRVACVGPATASALRAHGIEAAVIPDDYVAEGLVRALAHGERVAGTRVLLAQAEAARPVVAAGLTAAGARVDAVVAYRTVPARAEAGPVRRQLRSGEIDLVTFTSPSTVRNFVAAAGADAARAPAAVIGPVTESTAREYGLRVEVVAREHTVAGLLDAIVEGLGDGPPHP